MPNYSARDMLLRMAEGGSVASANQSVLDFINNNPDASVEAIATKINSSGADLGFLADSLGISRDIADQAYSEAMATNNALLGAEQRILGEIAADPASWNAANAYNEVLKSGVSVQDALDAGVKQSTIDAVFTSGAPLPETAFSTPSTVASAFESAPYAGQSMEQIRSGAQNYVSGLMADGVIDEAERREAQAIATQQGVTFQDMLAAGVDPSILFNTPAAKEPDAPINVDPVPDPFPQTQPEYVPPTVYQPIAPQPDIYAPGEEALDREFRDSPPRTEVLDQYGNLAGFDYTPAAKFLSATGSGFSFTPPSVTSRPRSLMDTGTLNRYTQGRAAQDLRQLSGANYDRYADLLNRTGSYGGGLSRSQLFALMRQQDSMRREAEREEGTADTEQVPYGLTSGFTGLTEGDEESRQSNFTTQGYNTELLARDLGTAGGARIVPVFAEGGPVKKPEGFADNGPADSMTADELTAQLMAMDTQEPRPTDQVQTESRSILENMLSGAKRIPSSVYEYGKEVVQSQSPSAKLLADIYGVGKTMQAGAADDPVGYALDMAPVTGEIRSGMDVEKYTDLANEARAAGDTDLAEMYEQVVLMSVAGASPLLGMGARGTKKAAVTTALKAADRAAAGRKAQKLIESQPTVKASEALGQLMEQGFKRTSTTQADRTRVGGGNIGGAAFSAISEADPNYAGKVWGVMDSGTASRLTNLTSPETAWTTMLGSATQLKTNPIVFDKLKKGFVASMKAGNLSPELAEKININLAVTFGEGADIRDPKIWAQADTFEKRAALADIMMGQGLPPSKGGISLGGEKSGKGVIFKPTEILIKETEKALLHPIHGGDAPTFAAGPRLFSLDGTADYRPDLHPGFPTLLGGGDLGVSMQPTPTEVYLPDWHRQFKADNPSRKGPGYYDLALGVKGKGLPSQELTDEYIRHLLREGFSEGGEVKKPKGSASSDLEELGKYAGGGLIEKAIQKGAEALGFDDERQVAISQEAVDLTNQMVDSGLIGEQYRVELLLPEDASKRTRQNTGIKGDEEVFNAVNHALFAYDAGQNPLSAVGAQAKEVYQGLNKKMGGSDPRSEYLDYFNNKFGFNLAKQGLSRQEAKNAIMDTLGNINNQGTRGRMMKGEPVKAGTDLLTNVEDAKYPWE